MLEDLVLALDKDLTDKLDYRELAKGMGLWKVEKRANKRSRVASGEYTERYKSSPVVHPLLKILIHYYLCIIFSQCYVFYVH